MEGIGKDFNSVIRNQFVGGVHYIRMHKIALAWRAELG